VAVKSKLAKGVAWIAAARQLANLLTVATTVALARLLLPSDFGLVAIATAAVMLLSSVTDLSLAASLIQHRAPTVEHYHTAWTLGLIRSASVSAICCALAWPVASLYHEPRLIAVMLALASGIFLTGLPNPRAQVLTKQLIFWQQALLQVAQKAAVLLVAVVIAVLTHSYWALVWGTIAGQFVAAAISFTVLPYRPRLSLKHYREILNFSVWMSLFQIVNTVNWRFDQLLIGGLIGKGALGYYGMAETVAAVPTREATAPIASILFPGFSSVVDEPRRLAAAYQSAQALVTAIALPAGVGMALLAEPVIRLTSGAKWLPSVFAVQVLASVFALQTLGNLSQPLAMAAGQTKLIFHRSLQALVVRLPFVITGAVLAGLNGIIWARAGAAIIDILFHLWVVRRVAGLTLVSQLRANFRTLASTFAMVGVVLFLSSRIGAHLSTIGLAAEILGLGAAGAATYVIFDIVVWRLSGQPAGPEVEIIKALRSLPSRLATAHASKPTVSVTLDPS
jgi:PST family polysaccharide transporter